MVLEMADCSELKMECHSEMYWVCWKDSKMVEHLGYQMGHH